MGALFDELGQKDRKVFIEGEIETCANSLGYKTLRKTYMTGKERLMAPNLIEAPSQDLGNKEIGRLIKLIDPNAKPGGLDCVHKGSWEIVHFGKTDDAD